AKSGVTEAVRDVVEGSLRHEQQDIEQAVGGFARAQGLLDEFGNALFRANAGTQVLRSTGTLRFDAVERGKRLLHGGIAAFRACLLAQSDEGRADQRLQFGIALGRQLVSYAPDAFNQGAAIAAAVEFGQLAEADGGGAASLIGIETDAS